MASPLPLETTASYRQFLDEQPLHFPNEDPILDDAVSEVLELHREDFDLRSVVDRYELPEFPNMQTETIADPGFMHESNAPESPFHEIDDDTASFTESERADIDVVGILLESDLEFSPQTVEDEDPIALTSEKTSSISSSRNPTPISATSFRACDPKTTSSVPVVVSPQSSTRQTVREVQQVLSPIETLPRAQCTIVSGVSLPNRRTFAPISPSSSLSSSPVSSRPSSPDSLSAVLSRLPSPSSSPLPTMKRSFESDSWAGPILDIWSAVMLGAATAKDEAVLCDEAAEDDLKGRQVEEPCLEDETCSNCCPPPKKQISPAEPKKTKKRTKPSVHRAVPQTERLVYSLGEHDVVFGRGGKSIHHVGNIRFRDMILKHLEEYRDSNKAEKTAIARSVVREITQDLGGRFLMKKEGDHCWTVVPFQRARIKASQRFREALSKRGWGQGSAAPSSSSSAPLLDTEVEDGEENDEVIEIFD